MPVLLPARTNPALLSRYRAAVSPDQKKYQVFVSATCEDLRDERHRLMELLIAAGCIPAGADLCPRDASPQQWGLIKSLIDDSDYYLILVGGRYGTLAPTGVSYTHREFTYALTKRKPMAALIHDRPEDLSQEKRERNAEGMARLRDFRDLVSRSTLSRPWNQLDDLKPGIDRLLAQLVKNHPSPGWVKGSVLATVTERENQDLRRQMDDLRRQLDQALKGPVIRPEVLARGSDTTSIAYTCNVYVKGNCIVTQARTQMTWDAVFSILAPAMMNEVTEDQMRSVLATHIAEGALKDVADQHRQAHAVRDIVISPVVFNTIKMHFRALGYIRKGAAIGPGGQPTWQLTPQGDQYLVSLMAVRRSS